MASSAARSSAAALVGGVIAAIGGFALAVIIGRSLGAEGAGLVSAGIAITTIVILLAPLGTETALLWSLPRGRTLGRGVDTPRVLRWAFAPVIVVSATAGLVMWLLAPPIADLIGDRDAAGMVRVFALAVVVGGPTVLAVQATRALGSVRPFVTLQQITLPLLRVAAVGGAVALGAATVERVAWGWVLPLVVVGTAASVVTIRRAQRVVREAGPAEGQPTSVRGVWRFAVRRLAANAGAQLLTWLDVIIVAALTTPSVAGVYAAASRFVTTGRIAGEATRIAVGPQVSQAFARGSIADVSTLGRLTALWSVALSWPLYIVMGVFGGTLLSLFGPDFTAGAVPLAILSGAMLFAVGTGGIGMILNMSGRSGLLAINVWTAVAVNVSMNLLLVPRYGAIGAALAWTASLLVENVMGVVQVRRMGVRMYPRSFWQVAGLVAGLTGVVVVACRQLFGDTPLGLAVAVVGVAAVLLPVYVLKRDVLHLDGLLRRSASTRVPERA
jgi:O-antigen/teichoic acid export membrane protein